MKIRVMHLLGPLRPSGMERMLVTAAPYFQAEGVDSVVVGQGKHNPFAADLRRAGYDVREVGPVGRSAANARVFKKLVRDLDIDVVHIHTEGNYLLTASAARWALGRRGAIVRTVHSIFAAKGMWHLRRLLQASIADRMVSGIIAPSPDVAAQECRMLRKTRVIFNWVDDELYSLRQLRLADELAPHPRPTAVLVGNCSDIKQHEMALEAVLASGHSAVHLGDESQASLREVELLNNLERSGRLLDRGVRSPYEALIRGNYFIMSSSHEGMSVALAEAIVAGVPALVNDVQGLQWARNVSGVVMVANNPTAWVEAVRNWKLAAGAGNQDAPDLSASRGAKDYAQEYRRALGYKLN